MAIDFLTVEEAVEDNGFKCLVHGLSGVGKTVLCSTTGETTIILSAEKGLRPLKKLALENPKAFKKIRVVIIKKMKDLEKFFEEASEERLASWLAFDSISEIAEQILSKGKKDNKDGRKAYMIMQEEIITLLRQFRDLDYNVLMTCKQKMLETDDGMIYMPMLPGKNLPQEIPYMFDNVFAMRVEEDEEGKSYRTLQTDKDRKYFAKDRSGLLDMFEEPNIKVMMDKLERKYAKLERKNKNEKGKSKNKKKESGGKSKKKKGKKK